jgi:predicted RNA-binding Zn-ribbon protein involved in translation (DUF1610 family)
VSENKQIAGPILGVVGGLVILIYGAVEVYLAEVVSSIATLNGLPVLDIGGAIIAGILGIVLGLFIMAFSVVAASSPDYHVGLGALIVLFAVFSLVSVGGGNSVGFLLAVLGGTCCIVFGPEEPPPSPPVLRASPAPSATAETAVTPRPVADASGRTHHACPNCGAISLVAFTSCPSCGQKF